MGVAGERDITAAAARRILKRIAVITVAAFILGAIYAMTVDYPDWQNWHRGALGGALMALIITAIHFFYVQGPQGQWINRTPYALSFVILGLIYFIVMLMILMSLAWIYEVEDRGLFPGELWFQRHVPFRDFAAAFVVTLLVMLMSTISALLGAGALRAIATGRYHQPRRELRIALLIDLRSSTAIAEKLGDQRYYDFLNRFFVDISQELIEHGGEIDAFIGDGLLAMWPLSEATGPLNAIKACQNRIAANKTDYEARFGLAPSFRAALHCGEALLGEIGAERRQIVAIGDFLNVTARIEGEARRRNLDFIASSDYLAIAGKISGWVQTPLGPAPLRGRTEAIDLIALAAESSS